MLMVNYHNKVFRTIENSPTGETNTETEFHYKQIGNIVFAENYGGNIKYGHLIGLVSEYGTIEMSYHQVNNRGEMMTGKCESIPEIMANGKVRLHESWEWTCGDFSKGKSIVEEK